MSEYLVLKDGRVLGPVPPDKVEPIFTDDRITGYVLAEGVLETLPDVGPDPRNRVPHLTDGSEIAS